MRKLFILIMLIGFLAIPITAFAFKTIEEFGKAWKQIEEINKSNIEEIREQRDRLNEILKKDYNQPYKKRHKKKHRPKSIANRTCEDNRREGRLWDTYWKQFINVVPYIKKNTSDDHYTNIPHNRFYVMLSGVDHKIREEQIKPDRRNYSTWYTLGHAEFRKEIGGSTHGYSTMQERNNKSLLDPISGKVYCGNSNGIVVWGYDGVPNYFKDISKARTRKVKRYPNVFDEVNHDTLYWRKLRDGSLTMMQMTVLGGRPSNYLFGPFKDRAAAEKYLKKVKGISSKYLRSGMLKIIQLI